MTPEETEIFNNKLVAWQTLKAKIARECAPLIAQEMELRREIMATAFPAAKEGVNNHDLGHGYTLKGTRKVEYSLSNTDDSGWLTDAAVEAIEKLGEDGPFIAERLVTWKPSLSVKEYKALSPTNPIHIRIRELIDTALTIKDGAPTIEITPPKTAG